jgi:hypothetical protein
LFVVVVVVALQPRSKDMGNDIEATPHSRHLSNEDANSLKAPSRVGRQELADIVPPHDSYEGNHRFDPYASWSIEEERRVVRKTDLRLLTWLCLMMFGYACIPYVMDWKNSCSFRTQASARSWQFVKCARGQFVEGSWSYERRLQ